MQFEVYSFHNLYTYIHYFTYLNVDHEDFEEDKGDVEDDEEEEEEEEEELLDEEAQLMASMGLPVAFASTSVKKKNVRDYRTGAATLLQFVLHTDEKHTQPYIILYTFLTG